MAAEIRLEKRCFLAKREMFKHASPVVDEILKLRDACKEVAGTSSLSANYLWDFVKEILELDCPVDVVLEEGEEDSDEA